MVALLYFLLLCIPFSMHSMSTLFGKSFLSTRSQSVYAGRELVGWYRFINLYNKPGVYGAFYATPQFGRSFRPARIAQALFGTDQLVISGSQVANRQPNQLLADYFGLSPVYQSTVNITPRITTFLVDLDAYIGYQSWYIRAHAPVVWTKNNLHLCEVTINNGSSVPYPPLYMAAPSTVAPSESFRQSVAGGITFGDIVQGIEKGRMVPKSAAGLSEVQLALGYNFINCPNGHAGLNLRGYIPTGTRPNSTVLFEPLVGNGHHGEIGVGFTGHVLLWEKDCDQQLAFYTDANLTHMLATKQCRSFDLCGNGFMSRYMLVKEFNESGNYTGQTIPLINVSTLACSVSAAIQLDWVFMFAYTHAQWSFDIGYEAWLRTHENITLKQELPLNTYALKGIQNVDTIAGTSNATQSNATIFGNPFSEQVTVADSNPPVFLNTANLDIHSAEASLAFTNTILWHLSYIFPTCHNFDSFLGIGGQAEFEGLNPRQYADNNHNSVSQWAVWVKTGIGF